MILKLSSPLSTCCCILQPCLYQSIAASCSSSRWKTPGRQGGLCHHSTRRPQFQLSIPLELWKDYLLRFEAFVNDNYVPDEKKALVFLSNMISGTCKLITNYASQQDVPTIANVMQFSDITDFMSSHYDPTQFTMRERYKFWSTIKRKPGATSTELAARIRQMATTCDFPTIKNPLDEAMRTCFICAINNEAIIISPCSVRRKKSWRSQGRLNRDGSGRSSQYSQSPGLLKAR